MMVASVLIVSILLVALFVGVTIAGGRSHDRQNAVAAEQGAPPPQDDAARPSPDRLEDPSPSIQGGETAHKGSQLR
jgi:hypothetical protein